MFNLKLKAHSVIDVITNSSSVVYVEATTSTINCMKEIVKFCLLESGVSSTEVDGIIEDKFKFRILIDDVEERIDEYEPDEAVYDEFHKLYPKQKVMSGLDTWQEKGAAWRKRKLENGFDDSNKWDMYLMDLVEKFEISTRNYSDFEQSYVCISCDDDKYDPLCKRLQTLVGTYNLEGSYDG